MRSVQNFTQPDFQAKTLTWSISPNFNSLSDKNTNKWKWRNLHCWQKCYTPAGSDERGKSHLWDPLDCSNYYSPCSAKNVLSVYKEKKRNTWCLPRRGSEATCGGTQRPPHLHLRDVKRAQLCLFIILRIIKADIHKLCWEEGKSVQKTLFHAESVRSFFSDSW